MFAEKLLSWYQEYGRVLPWRGIDNPYHIWLSEIILQQTRIEQGRDYYNHFVAEYPTIADLADATEERVLKSWQGLGYYSRARNLHAAAQHVANELGGHFPNTYEGILALKGVGKYTAAAVASFAYRLPYPVIDGNVYRLVSRLYGISTPVGTNSAYQEFERLLSHLIDKDRPDLFNHAIMDFGSIYCKPVGCDCHNCIFRQECVACRDGRVSEFPVRLKKARVRDRYFCYVDIRWDNNLLVQCRAAGDIWQGLYELPLYEAGSATKGKRQEKAVAAFLEAAFGVDTSGIIVGPAMKHKLTHQTVNAQFYRLDLSSAPIRLPENVCVVNQNDLHTLPVSRLIDRYLSMV